MKNLSMWPASLLWLGSAALAQAASEPASGSKVWPALQQETAQVRERLESAMDQRRQMRTYEQAVAQTGRQIRAETQAQNRIRDAIRMQESLIAQDQEEIRRYERNTPTHAAMLQHLTQHQQLLEQLRSQDEQLVRVQDQLKAQQQEQQERRDQMRQR